MKTKIKSSYINGQFLAREGHEDLLQNINPSKPTDIVDEFIRADAQMAERAVLAANKAQKSWQHSSPQCRSDLLDRIGNEILNRKVELGELLAREEGKTRVEAIAEAEKAGRIFKFYAQQALQAVGEKYASVREGVSVDVIREPVGVIGVIAPWNFPLAIPAWKIAPALCYGNSVVFKPAELVPSSAWALTQIIHESGVPAGVFNMLIGSGREVGNALIKSDHIQAITFTGSESVGRQIAIQTVQNLIPVQLEMGGKNPLIVLDDADLDLAVELVVHGAFYSTGQRCTATSRLIVTEGIYAPLVEKLEQRTLELKVGNALEEGVDIGPVVDAKQLQQNLDYVASGLSEGASLLCGGEHLPNEDGGYFFSPAIFVDVKPDMKIYQEEIFGPVLSVIKVPDYEAALEVAENTTYGLSAGIVTNSLHYAEDFKKRSSAGIVMVNLTTAGVDHHVPFGGNKASSFGPREQGTYAKEFFTKVKTAYQ